MNKIIYNAEQLQAIEMARQNKVTLITGGAGTGKTTLIKGITEELDNNKIMLVTPTGKASARLKEATRLETSTIHRALGFNGMTFSVKSLSGLTIICDEASMVDSKLLYEITKRNPEKIILVGDNAQLFPVSAGCPFHDLIQLFPDKTVDLKINYRSQSAVHQAGQMVRVGKMVKDNMQSGGEKFQFINAKSPEQCQKEIINLIKKNKFNFEQDIIICPKNGELNKQTGLFAKSTVKGLNKEIVNIVNPRHNNYQGKFQIGDRIICKKNFPEEDVWNGTTGTVTAIDSEKHIWVKNDLSNKEVLFNGEMIKESQLAYALTIHKSQGSQYRNVIVVCLLRDSIMLSRRLIYTAITRTKTNCIVIGQKMAFMRALVNIDNRRTVMGRLMK